MLLLLLLLPVVGTEPIGEQAAGTTVGMVVLVAVHHKI
jgi:hypothetical protein